MQLSFKKLSFFREKRFWLAFLLFIFIGIFIVFAPFLWASNIAESGTSSVQPNTTVLTKFNILTPEYAVFNTTNNYGAQVSFIELERVWLVWWQVKPVSSVSFSTPNSISNDEKKRLQDQNLSSLQNAVQSGRITSNSSNPSYEMDELTKNLIDEQNKNQQPGTERFSIQDSSQTYTIIVLNGLTYPENSVLLNGEVLTNVKNVFSIDFEQTNDTAKFIYFTSYEVFETLKSTEGNGEDGYGTVQFSGVIQRYSLESKKVETVHTVKKGAISVKANQEKVLFFSSNDENGVFNLATQKIQAVTLPAHKKNEEDRNKTFTEILDLGEETGVIKVYEHSLNAIFRIQLNTGEAEEL